MLELTPLDPSNENQIKFMYNLRTNPAIDGMLSGDPPKNYEQHNNYLQKNHKRFFIAINDKKNLIGYSQLSDMGEVGFVVSPDFQGKGYGKSLVIETLKIGFKTHEKLNLVVLKNNPVAIHIYEKYGFKTVSTAENEVVMELAKEEMLC